MEEFHILDNIPDLSEYKSFTERYFTKRYAVNVNGIKNNDFMVLFHSNRITLLCLAPSHFFYKKKEEYKINFNVGNIDRLLNVVKGKGKKGGQMLYPKSIVCKIEYEDGTSIDVPSCMKGSLIEINDELVKDPQILMKHPNVADGYIAVILSSIAISEETKNEMLTPEQYEDSLNTTDST